MYEEQLRGAAVDPAKFVEELYIDEMPQGLTFAQRLVWRMTLQQKKGIASYAQQYLTKSEKAEFLRKIEEGKDINEIRDHIDGIMALRDENGNNYGLEVAHELFKGRDSELFINLSKLESDKYFGELHNSMVKRNIETTLLFDVGDINKIVYNSSDQFDDMKWLSAKEIKNLKKIEPSDRLLLDKAINHNLDLKEKINKELDRKYDGANKLLNKLLRDDKKGLIELLDHGYNVNSLTSEDQNVVFLAAYRDDCKDLLKTLIEKYDADINQEYWPFKFNEIQHDHKFHKVSTILGIAISNNDLELVKYLVSYGANINDVSTSVTDRWDNIKLACLKAIKTNNFEMLDFLFSQGAVIENHDIIHYL